MNLIFVTKEEAQAYLLPANSTILLLDRDEPKFYIKSTDAIGQSSIKTYKFEEIQPDPATIPLTQADLLNFKNEILSILNVSKQENTTNE